MTISTNILDVACATGAGAATGSMVGPLGAAGGALYGLFGSVSYKVVHYTIDRALRNNDNFSQARKEAIKSNGAALATMALFASVFAAAAITGVPITFTGVVVTLLAAIPISIPFYMLADLIKNAFLINGR